MPVAFLLALQAAGMVIDYLGTQNQAKFAEMGMKAEQAAIESNIAQHQLETEDASLQSLKQLRQHIGTQIATFAARGTALGAGSSLISVMGGISDFKSDERTRRINAMGKENQLMGGAAISRLQHMSDTSKLWQGFSTRTLNRFPTSPAAYSKIGSSLNNEGFGLSKFTG